MPTAATTSKYLAIYLNDHLAGSTGGLELAKRAAGEHKGSELGAFLAGLCDEIAADRKELEAIMHELGVTANPAKQAVAWAGEKAGRLKPNGELRGRSPLTPLVELEALLLGITGKRSMWTALLADDGVARSVGRPRLERLVARAEQQRDDVDRHRLEAARQAISV
jgi:hypothetical protein